MANGDDKDFADLAAALDELDDELEDKGEKEVGPDKNDDEKTEKMLEEVDSGWEGMTAKEIRKLEQSVKPV